MERHRLQISLASILVVVAVLGFAFASWTWTGEARIFVTPIAAAFIGGFTVRYGFYVGVATAFAIVMVIAIRMEKDPSGLGPNEFAIPYLLAIFALPVSVAAWLGSKVREGTLQDFTP